MKHIKFSVGKELEKSDSEDFQQKFEMLCGISAERFARAFHSRDGNYESKYSLRNILLEFVKSSLKVEEVKRSNQS
jgi:hypothetical protein